MRLAEAWALTQRPRLVGEVMGVVYTLDRYGDLSTGNRLLPDGSILSIMYGEEPEQPPPDGEHDPADPEEEEDPGKMGGGPNRDRPGVVSST